MVEKKLKAYIEEYVGFYQLMHNSFRLPKKFFRKFKNKAYISPIPAQWKLAKIIVVIIVGSWSRPAVKRLSKKYYYPTKLTSSHKLARTFCSNHQDYTCFGFQASTCHSSCMPRH